MLTRFLSLLRQPFVRDVGFLQIGQMVATGCSFLSSIIYARYLGLGGYGLYAVVLAFTGMFGLITNLGQQFTTLTFMAEAQSRRDRNAMIEILQYYIIMTMGMLCILAIFFILFPLLSGRVYGDATIGNLGRLVLLSSMLDPPLVFFSIALQVVRRIRFLAIFENAQVVFQLLFAFIFLVLGKGVAGILWSSILGSLVFSTLALILYPRIRRQENLPTVREVLTWRGGKSFWKYAKDGMWIAIDKNIGNLYSRLFIFILSTRTSTAVVGLVRLAFKLGDLPFAFALSNVTRLANSVIPNLAGRGIKILMPNLRRLVRHALLLHVAISLAAAILIPPLLPVVYEEGFRPAIYPFFVLLTLNLLLVLHTFTTPILRFYSRIYYSTILNVISMASAVATFYVCSQFFDPTRSLYAALAVYHVTICLVIFPTLRLLKTHAALEQREVLAT